MTVIQNALIWIIPLLFAITLHEVAHGWVADKLGDHTAKMMGRLTLNPLKHTDPIGTILVPAILYFSSGFIFGWAKPVPINPNALGSMKKDMLLVSIAGPAANFIMAIFWLVVIVLASYIGHAPFIKMGQIGIYINLVLGILNLLPIPPLDGAKVLDSMLPARLSYKYNKLEPYGFFILLGLIFLGIFQSFILPIVIAIQNFMLGLVF